MFLLVALLGAVAASLLACVPALHVYNVAGLLLLLGAGASPWMDAQSLSAPRFDPTINVELHLTSRLR